MRDLHNQLKFAQLFPPIAAVTDNTPFVSNIIDTLGFDAVELVMTYGSISDSDATFTVLVEEGNNSSLTDNSAVADNDLLGLEASTITAGASAGDGAAPGFADDNKTCKIGYKGNKRYLRVTVTPAANTGNIYMAGVAALGYYRGTAGLTSQIA